MKYKVRLKGKINIYKDIEVEALNKEDAKKKGMEEAFLMVEKCFELMKKDDKDIKHYMSYFDIGKRIE